MTEAELRSLILETLSEIAPEIDPADIAPDRDLREEVDLDSMDFLNFVIALHEALGVDISEADYPQLGTIDGCVAYLGEAVEAG